MELFFEFIFEIIFECLFEGALEICKNKKISRWIRYPLLCFLLLFIMAVIGLVFWVAILAWKENVLAGAAVFIAGIVMAGGCVNYARKHK